MKKNGWQRDHNVLGSLKARPKEVDGVNEYVRERWNPKRSIRTEAETPAYHSFRDLLDRRDGED